MKEFNVGSPTQDIIKVAEIVQFPAGSAQSIQDLITGDEIIQKIDGDKDRETIWTRNQPLNLYNRTDVIGTTQDGQSVQLEGNGVISTTLYVGDVEVSVKKQAGELPQEGKITIFPEFNPQDRKYSFQAVYGSDGTNTGFKVCISPRPENVEMSQLEFDERVEFFMERDVSQNILELVRNWSDTPEQELSQGDETPEEQEEGWLQMDFEYELEDSFRESRFPSEVSQRLTDKLEDRVTKIFYNSLSSEFSDEDIEMALDTFLWNTVDSIAPFHKYDGLNDEEIIEQIASFTASRLLAYHYEKQDIKGMYDLQFTEYAPKAYFVNVYDLGSEEEFDIGDKRRGEPFIYDETEFKICQFGNILELTIVPINGNGIKKMFQFRVPTNLDLNDWYDLAFEQLSKEQFEELREEIGDAFSRIVNSDEE